MAAVQLVPPAVLEGEWLVFYYSCVMMLVGLLLRNPS